MRPRVWCNGRRAGGRARKMGELERGLIDEARRRGFARGGMRPAAPADGFERLREWVDRGCAGEMGYLCGERTELRRDPRSVCPPVRSVVMVAMSYAPSDTESEPGGGGRFQG